MSQEEQKIVILTDWFLPAFKAGGPIQSCANLAFALEGEYKVFVITGDTDAGDSTPYVDTVDQWVYYQETNIKVYYASKAKRDYNSILELLLSIKPHSVYLNHLFSIPFVLYPLLMSWVKQLIVRIIICPRGALFYSALHYKNTYFKKMLVITWLRYSSVMKLVEFHATTPEEELTIRKFFPRRRVTIINNLLHSTLPNFRKVEKRENELKLIFIARIVPIKNLEFVLKLINKCTFAIELSIIGPIEDQEYWQDCLFLINAMPSHIQVNYRGAKATNELNFFLQANHLFILPTKGENFGHSIAEALRSCRPVLISDKTPWRNLADAGVGWDLPIDSEKPFLTALHTAAAWNQEVFDKHCINAFNFATAFSKQNNEIEKYKALFS